MTTAHGPGGGGPDSDEPTGRIPFPVQGGAPPPPPPPAQPSPHQPSAAPHQPMAAPHQPMTAPHQPMTAPHQQPAQPGPHAAAQPGPHAAARQAGSTTGQLPPVPGYPPPMVGPAPVPVSGAAVSAGPKPRRTALVLAVVALVASLALGAVAIVQARQISDLRGDLASARADAGRVQASDDQRLDSLEGQVTQLGEQAGRIFDPQAVAAAVLPSVFRITAGELTGTAFAVGEPSGGSSRLLTAYHVVREVWGSGSNRVELEREGQTYSATVTDVDQANDIAVLSASVELTGLAPATEPVRSGQQIVVVGSPLGLTDSVTVGVVSALRKGEGGAGDLIQFDASINPGNSGGPVVNTAKQVVGIASLKARDSEGIGLATPIQTACTKFRVC